MSGRPAYMVFVPTMLLLAGGLLMVFSAGTVYGFSQGGYRYFVPQLCWGLFGFALMVFCAKIDYHRLMKLSLPAVLLSVVLLVVVLVMGKVSGGARLGIHVGFLYFQPTELAKVTMVMFAAYSLSRKGERARELMQLLVPVLALTAVIAVLMALQPDLGGAMIMVLGVVIVVYMADTRASHLLALGAGIGVAAGLAVWKYPYVWERIRILLNPWSDPQGYGYQVIQSQIALGSGHIKGLGLGMSRQKYMYLPNAHNDFIFAIVGEELGLAGTLAVVALVGFLAFGGFRIAAGAPDRLGRLLAAGITGVILVQALVNMAGVVGLLPITGVPLPMVSAGGSSLCLTMACVGVLLNIASQGSR